MRLSIGQKITVLLPLNNKTIDFTVNSINMIGDQVRYNMTYKYHDVGSRQNLVDYNQRDIDRFFRDKNWVLQETVIPNTFPEDLFTL